MNTRDLSHCEHLRRQIGETPRPGLYILNVASTQFVVVELVLLKALIGKGNPGLFISVDRPHQYIVHLLDMHRIDRDQLNFIDAVSQFSQGIGECRERVGFLNGPSHIDELPGVLSTCSASVNGFDISTLQFTLVDNVSILLMYNSRQAVEAFLDEFVRLLSGNMAVVIVVDRNRNHGLYRTLLSLGGIELKLELQGDGTPDRNVARTGGPIGGGI
ncbi:MAG: hypothetical protein GXY70_06645 [Euryarchaeota archaeon]|nr:hypothetical protein [Euryarchaeota archaeon]